MKTKLLKFLIIAVFLLPVAPVQAQRLFLGGAKEEADDKPSRVFIAPKPSGAKKENIISRFFKKKQPTYTQAFQETANVNFTIPKDFDMGLLSSSGREPQSELEFLTIASIQSAPKLNALKKRLAKKQRELSEFKAYNKALHDRAEYNKKRNGIARANREERQQTRAAPQQRKTTVKPGRVFTDF